MRPLTSSLTKKQLTEKLDLPPEIVEALLDSGRVLCHVVRGEIRVPLAQLETFFREALIRTYQAEVGGDVQDLGALKPATPQETRTAAVIPRPEPEPSPEPESDPEPEPQQDPEPQRDPEPQQEPEPAPEPIILTRPPLPALPPPGSQMAVDEPDDRPDQRVASRYVPLRQLSGIFGDTKFSMLQLSATGLRIRHSEPLMPGDEGKLSFALMKPARSVVVRARVVWTSVAKSGDDRFSISGLRIIEHADRLEQAIATLKASHELQPERRARLRRAGDALTLIGGISDEEMALVTGAVHKFASDPVEASRWYSRARFALSDETVRRLAPERPREREEVLGIWEYLERRVDIAKIAGVVSWMRAN